MDASADLRGQLQRFRDAYPARTVAAAGHLWEVVDTRSGAPTLLVLPGPAARADALFQVAQALAPDVRVLAVGYPRTLETVADALAGLRAVLDQAGVRQAYVLGHSFGAALAGCLARASPERVRGLALANLGLYTPLRARLAVRTLALMGRLPARVLERLFRAHARALAQQAPARAFWQEYLGAVARERGPDLANAYRALLDLLRQPPFTPAALAGWEGSVLLLEAELDAGFTPEEQTALRELFPQAQVHLFAGAGHLAYLEHPEEFARALRAWLGR